MKLIDVALHIFAYAWIAMVMLVVSFLALMVLTAFFEKYTAISIIMGAWFWIGLAIFSK